MCTTGDSKVLVKFVNDENEAVGASLEIPLGATTQQLQVIVNALLDSDDKFTFHVAEHEITFSLSTTLEKQGELSSEKVIEIVYQPQAIFKVRAVSRCTSSIPGHTEAVINAAFSCDGRKLASGSGDTTVRFWDINTETPLHTCQGHSQWVLTIAWNPAGDTVASGCKKGDVILWDPETGARKGKVLTGHKKWISSLAWQPLHLATNGISLLASASKDNSVKVWDPVRCLCVYTLSSHTQGVTCLRWSGDDLLYSASQDRTIKVWRPSDGVMCRTLQGHAHWVNTMALSTDYAARIGCWDPAAKGGGAAAQSVYNKYKGGGEEMLVSGSDDFTLFLWQPAKSSKPIARLTGHQQLINQVMFSPNGRTVASASFDKSVKVWCGRAGKFISTLRGHVKAVYQISWSADNKLLASASSDSTVKVWCMRTFSLLNDLPGHADEVYTVDWSPCGTYVVSGGKDKVLKVWRA